MVDYVLVVLTSGLFQMGLPDPLCQAFAHAHQLSRVGGKDDVPMTSRTFESLTQDDDMHVR